MLDWHRRVSLMQYAAVHTRQFIGQVRKLHDTVYIKDTVDTFGNCQRPVFSLGVSQHNYALNHQTCANFNSTGRRSCDRIKVGTNHNLGLVLGNIQIAWILLS